MSVQNHAVVIVPRCRIVRIVLRAKDVTVVCNLRFTVASAPQDAAAITVSLESRIVDVPKNNSALAVIRNGKKAAKSVRIYLKNVARRVCPPFVDYFIAGLEYLC